jgi:hypothetical protein
MESNVSKYKSSSRDIIFEMSVKTPYPEGDIIDFMRLTGLDIDNLQNIINRFSASGISNLRDVNTLAKLGFLKF